MIDDLISISHCGLKSVVMNSFLNSKSKVKKLQLGIDKCHKLHIGKEKKTCPDLFIDKWIVENVDETNTSGRTGFEDVLVGDHLIEEVSEEKYLGDIISKDGKNIKNIKARKDKAIGSSNQIMSILEEICFGRNHFEVAIVLRNSLLINSLLFNSEAWYNVSNHDIEELEKADESLLRRILECPLSTTREMLYLELSCIPVRFIILSRRIMFLHYILNESESSLVQRFLKAQEANPTKNDWCQSVQEALNTLELELSINTIKLMKKEDLKVLVKEACENKALEYLNKVKAKHSKVRDIQHSKWEMQGYLQPNQEYLSIQEAKFIFLLRTRMLDVKVNFENKYRDKSCPNCETREDSQPHLLECVKLIDGTAIANSIPDYCDLFGDNLGKMLNTSRIIENSFRRRKNLSLEGTQVNQ